MKAQHHNTTFTSKDIGRYLNKEMTTEEMHAMEKAALDDPFLADAIEGYSELADTSGVTSVSTDLGELRTRLEDRIQPERRKNKVIPFTRNQWWRIAAAIMLLAGTAGLVYTAMYTAEPSANGHLARKESNAPLPAHAETSNDTTSSDAAASRQEDKTMERETPPAGIVGRNEPITQRPANQNPANQTATMKDEAAEAVERESVEQKSVARKEANQQETQTQKQANIAAAPAARQQTEVVKQNEALMGEASNNARVFSPFVANNFNGRVVDQNNKPIAGATVIVENKNVGVSTDEDGKFNVILPDSSIKVKIASVGFEPASITLKQNLTDNRIVLKQSSAELSDVVVVGYGSQRKRSVSRNANASLAPVPTVGWEAYETYLTKNKRRPAGDTTSGSVMISFSTNKAGKPTNLKVEKSLKSALDAEALRLVKEGPAWKPAKNKARGRVTVTF
jgi:TonB family protein